MNSNESMRCPFELTEEFVESWLLREKEFYDVDQKLKKAKN